MDDVNNAKDRGQRDTGCESIAAIASRYTHRGWSVIPIPLRSKKPGIKAWQQLRLSEDDLPQHFNGHPENIGVLLGEPSGWLVDIDLDHPRAVEIASQHLPPTPLRFGRISKPESHWIYCVSSSVATKKHRSKSAGMIVELRSTGAQTVFPPSTHESGEAIEFVDVEADAAEVDPEILLQAVKALADAVLVELGERAAPRPTRNRKSVSPRVDSVGHPDRPKRNSSERTSLALQSILRMRVADHQDGSLRLYAAACRCVEHGLNDEEALVLLRQYLQLQPFPREWSDDELQRRVTDARGKTTSGEALTADTDHKGLIVLGLRDPESGRFVLSPRRTLPTALAYVAENHQHASGRTLHSHADRLMEWNGSCYVELEEGGARNRLLPWLHEALKYARDRESGDLILSPFDANPTSVRSALDSIKAHTHLPASIASPAWLDGRHGPPPDELLVCQSKLVHLPSGENRQPTPQLFVTNALAFDPDP